MKIFTYFGEIMVLLWNFEYKNYLISYLMNIYVSME